MRVRVERMQLRQLLLARLLWPLDPLLHLLSTCRVLCDLPDLRADANERCAKLFGSLFARSLRGDRGTERPDLFGESRKGGVEAVESGLLGFRVERGGEGRLGRWRGLRRESVLARRGERRLTGRGADLIVLMSCSAVSRRALT